MYINKGNWYSLFPTLVYYLSGCWHLSMQKKYFTLWQCDMGRIFSFFLMAYLKFLPCYPDVMPQLVRKGRDHSLCLRKAGREFLSQVCLRPPKRYLYQLHFEMCFCNTGREFFSPRHPLKPHHHHITEGAAAVTCGERGVTTSFRAAASETIWHNFWTSRGSQRPEPVNISDSSPCDIPQKGLWTQRGELLRLS